MDSICLELAPEVEEKADIGAGVHRIEDVFHSAGLDKKAIRSMVGQPEEQIDDPAVQHVEASAGKGTRRITELEVGAKGEANG